MGGPSDDFSGFPVKALDGNVISLGTPLHAPLDENALVSRHLAHIKDILVLLDALADAVASLDETTQGPGAERPPDGDGAAPAPGSDTERRG